MKEKILLIDDEPDILNNLSEIFLLEGFHVRTAFSGKEALETLEKEPFDLVITDMRMPGMDGLEVTERVKQMDKGMEVIILTGFGTIETAIKALKDHGVFDYLRKPLENIDEIVITAEKALERRRLHRENGDLVKKLKQANEELESRVRERTRELAKVNEKLRIELIEHKRISEKLLQFQRMEAVGQLAGGIAHDFNTILGTILGYGEMLRDHISEGSRARGYLEKLMKAGYRSKELVKQLMDFAHPSKEDRKPEKFALIVEESFELLRSSLPETIQIRKHIEVETETILANASQIHQVIMNLGMNARDAMADKGGVLEMSLTEVKGDAVPAFPHEVNEAYLKLTVSDSGCGIDPEFLEQIFEPFFTTKSVGEGTGLGLSVVHGIVQSHGGFVSVDSVPGKGSRFQVYLPKFRAEVPDSKVRRSKG